MAELETLLSDAVSTVSKLKETIGSSETNEALVELKKETASHVIDKLAEKRADIKIEGAKSLVVDYLVTEGFFDSFGDEIIKAGLDTFISSSKELQNLKEVIAENNTEEGLKNLESSILSHLESGGVFDDAWKKGITPSPTPHSDQSQDNQETATQTATEQEEQSEPSSGEEGLEGSAEEGEAKEVELKQRMQRLFPEGVPQTEKEMKKYLRKIKVPILTEDGKTKKITLYVHKKLAEEYKAIFKDMKKAGIKVNPETTACFNRRKMRNSSKMSHHSYGTAIDVNRDVNGGVYGKTDRNSPYFNSQACVDIWKKHGFYRGGDRKQSRNDPMHFTYMNA